MYYPKRNYIGVSRYCKGNLPKLWWGGVRTKGVKKSARGKFREVMTALTSYVSHRFYLVKLSARPYIHVMSLSRHSYIHRTITCRNLLVSNCSNA